MPLSWYYSEAAPALDETVTESAAAEGGDTGASHVSLVEVHVRGGNKIVVNGKNTDLDGFQKRVEKAVQSMTEAGDTGKTVVIAFSCDDDVSMSMVFEVQERLRRMNLMNMSYTTRAGRDLTLVLPPIDYEKRLGEIDEKHISTLMVTGGDTVELDGRRIKTAELGDAIRGILAADEFHILSVQISERATYGEFVEVLDTAKRADARRILVNPPAG